MGVLICGSYCIVFEWMANLLIRNSPLSKVQTLLCFVVSFLLATPIYRLSGIPAYVWMIFFLSSIIASGQFNLTPICRKIYWGLILYVGSCVYLSALFLTMAPINNALLFSATVFAFLQLKPLQIRTLINSASYLMVICIILSAIGVTYDLLGFQPILSLKNPNGDENLLFLTTFSHAKTFVIRPSAIFDEAGYLSLYISCLVIIRTFLKLPWKLTAFILLGGLLTQSMAHFIITTLWLLYFIAFNKKFNAWSINSAALNLVILIFFFSMIYSGIMDWAFERFYEWVDDPLISPRFRSFIHLLEMGGLDNGYLIYGNNEDCVSKLESCTSLGGNPLVPLMFGGLLYAWPYYLALGFLIFSSAFHKDRILWLMLFLILLGQPILLTFPYTTLFCLMLTTYISTINNSPKKNKI